MNIEANTGNRNAEAKSNRLIWFIFHQTGEFNL